jgi:hypothetical protein
MEPTPARTVHLIVDRRTGASLVLHDKASAVSVAKVRRSSILVLQYPPREEGHEWW